MADDLRRTPGTLRWPSRAAWRWNGTTFAGVLLVMVVLAAIDGEPVDAGNAMVAVAIVAGALVVAMLLSSYDFGRLGTLALALLVVWSLSYAIRSAVAFAGGGEDWERIILGLAVAGQAAYLLVQRRR